MSTWSPHNSVTLNNALAQGALRVLPGSVLEALLQNSPDVRARITKAQSFFWQCCFELC
jgi:hypothetical protein